MKKKKRSKLLIAVLILAGITLLLVAAVAGLWLHGQYSLRSSGPAPVLPAPQEAAPAQPEAEQPAPDSAVLDSYTVCYNGKYYRYNEDMCNILLLGVDAEEKPSGAAVYGDAHQADVLILAALDLARNKLSLISISRDTMCDLPLLDESGAAAGTGHAQLALSFSYGDGLERSCELTRDAVSNLFGGLQIQGYGALYLGGLPALNDAVGGVTLTVPADFPYEEATSLTPGAQVTLTGTQARKYIQIRDATIEGNSGRMQRQKQYILALLQTVKSAIRQDPTQILPIYDIVSDYTVTDLGLDRMVYLAAKAAGMEFDGEIYNLAGEAVLGEENHAEYLVDKAALSDLMIQIFYREVTP